MILAKEKIDYAVPEQPQQLQQPRRRASRKEIIRQKLTLIAMVCCCFIMGILVAYYYSQVAYVGYKIDCLQQKVTEMRLESHGLEQEVTQIISLGHIEDIAVNQLGMIKPDADDVVLVSSEPSNADARLPKKQDSSDEHRESITLPENETHDELGNRVIHTFTAMMRNR